MLGRQATSFAAGGNFGRCRHYLWGVVFVIGIVINGSLLSGRRPSSWAIEVTLSKDSGRYKNVRIAVDWQSQEEQIGPGIGKKKKRRTVVLTRPG